MTCLPVLGRTATSTKGDCPGAPAARSMAKSLRTGYFRQGTSARDGLADLALDMGVRIVPSGTDPLVAMEETVILEPDGDPSVWPDVGKINVGVAMAMAFVILFEGRGLLRPENLPMDRSKRCAAMAFVNELLLPADSVPTSRFVDTESYDRKLGVAPGFVFHRMLELDRF